MRHFLFMTFLAVVPAAVLAHGAAPAAQHGGVVAEASDEHWVELVLQGDRITVYVSDGSNKPIPSVRFGGKATVLAGGKSQQVILAAAVANSLTGQLDPPAMGKVTSVVTLTIDGKSSQVRFTTPQ